MKIVFAGGGTGGHFYPLIAIAEALEDIVAEQHLVAPRLFYLAPQPYDEEALFARDIEFVRIEAGRMRRHLDFENIIHNILDFFRTLAGFAESVVELFRIYPDAVISKGGFASVPVVMAAALIGIPIIIHESDTKPGRANLLAARFATRIGVAFESAARAFPPNYLPKIALIGIPIRRELMTVEAAGAADALGLEKDIPTVLILGGSSGSKRLNETVQGCLADLVEFANIVHQTGKAEFEEFTRTARLILDKNPHAQRYHPFSYFTVGSMRRAAGAATVIISRAGSTAIAELSHWGKPAILVPIPEFLSHDQKTNAYAYAETGAAVVIEEGNLSPHILASEARRIATDPELAGAMGKKGALFMPGDAARAIAEEAVRISLSHEPASAVATAGEGNAL